MKRIFITLLAMAIGFTPVAWAVDAQETNLYLIDISGAGSADLESVVNAAGGTLTHQMTNLGYASAYSEDPQFAKNLKKAKGVNAVTRDISLQWIPETADMSALTLGEDTVATLGHVTDPNTAAFGACQWHLGQIDTQTAWAKGYFGAGTTVAVLDSGVDPNHLDLANAVDVANSTSMISTPSICDNFAPDMGSFEDFRYHGSMVAGLVAGTGFGMAGVAPDTQIVAVKVLNCLGSGSFSDVIAGIVYAADLPQVDVINMSLGAYFPKNLAGSGSLVAAMNKAVNYANSKGKLVVSAAGNDGADLQHDGNFTSVPAESGAGIATWAGEISGGLAGYSNHGANAATLGAGGGGTPPAVPLPGCPVSLGGQGLMFAPCPTNSLFFNCVSGASYLIGSGTSFSAPVVSGVAALLDGKYAGSLNAAQLKTGLKNTADDIGAQGTDNLFGHGRVNADAATDL